MKFATTPFGELSPTTAVITSDIRLNHATMGAFFFYKFFVYKKDAVWPIFFEHSNFSPKCQNFASLSQAEHLGVCSCNAPNIDSISRVQLPGNLKAGARSSCQLSDLSQTKSKSALCCVVCWKTQIEFLWPSTSAQISESLCSNAAGKSGSLPLKSLQPDFSMLSMPGFGKDFGEERPGCFIVKPACSIGCLIRCLGHSKPSSWRGSRL